VGVTTNRRFLHAILGHPGFVQGRVDTHFIDNESASLLTGPTALDGDAVNIAAAYLVSTREDTVHDTSADPTSPWAIHDAFRLNLAYREVFTFTSGDASHGVTVEHAHDGSLVVESGWGRDVTAIVARHDSELAVRIGARRIRAHVVTDGADVHVFAHGQHYALNVTDPLHGGETGDAAAGGLTAPMPGTVLEVFVEVGQRVTAGTPLLLIEAMKIEHTIAAPFDGTVAELRFKAGDQIAGEGVELAVMEPD
jgi:3-methylcrotonyl-CoA carboxylase alpha subunit